MSKKNKRLEDKIHKLLAEIDLKVKNEALVIYSKNMTNSFLFTSNSKIEKQKLLNENFSTLLNNISAPKLITRKGNLELFESNKILIEHSFINALVIYPLLLNEKNVGFLLVFVSSPKASKQEMTLQNELMLLSVEVSEANELDNLTYYENVFNNCSEMVCVAGMDGFFKKINPAFKRTFLWSEEDLLSRRASDFVHSADLNELQKRARDLTRKTKSLDINIRLKQKKGSYRMIKWVLSFDYSKGLIYGIGRDITKEENTKNELAQAKEMLETTNRMAMIGGWEYVVKNKNFYWTPITRQILEIPEDFIINLSSALSFYSRGESHDMINEAFNKALNEGLSYDLEVEIVCAKGENKWVRAIGKPLFENGECVKVTGTFQDIDRDKKNRIALQVINSRMKAVLNASTETSIIATDITGRITHFNTGSEILLGFTAKEIVGIYTPIIFYAPEELEKQAKENSIQSGTIVKPGIDSFRFKSKMGIPDNGEFTYITRNSEKRNVKVSVTPIKDHYEAIVGYLSVAVDITEKKLWEKKILESEKRYRIFFENSQVVMYTHDMEGNFMSMNSIGAFLLGFTKNEIKSKNILDIIPFKSKVSYPYYLKELMENGKSKGLMQILNNYGVEGTWMYNNTVAESVSGEKYVLGNVMDITDRIELEKDLNESRKVAESNARMKDLFLANMSHEIRTPMNAITGFGELLKDTVLDEEQSDYLKSINIASSNLLNIINDILDFSKIESGQISIEKIEFNLIEQIKNVVSMLKPNAYNKQLDFELSIDPEIPLKVEGDPTRLSQILTNLISNAIKFTEEGFVKLEVILLEERANGDASVQFNVIDSGIGIPEDKIDIIFERFIQANTNTTRKYGGTGLGLSISKSLVELQAGIFHVKSIEEEGSNFGFTMPFCKAESTKIEIKETMSLENIGEYKILLVEDNLLNQKLALKVLEKQGFKATVAENGKLAVDILANEVFDLILMDLQMPEMDGYQATTYIRNVLKLDIPIISMTAHSLVGEKEKCLEIGMDDYLPKPFNQMELNQKINALLKKKNSSVRKTDKQAVNLEYLRSMAEGNKEFEKEIINTSLSHIPEDLNLLVSAIRILDLKQIASAAHKLKSSFYVMGIDDKELLKEFEMSGIDDLKTLENMFVKLENIYLASRESLEIELKENY
ncbi:MAG: PAS domain S-box-containing protein [Arcticibacterium sp.]|jgi:PAS domain S-box-containing protein